MLVLSLIDLPPQEIECIALAVEHETTGKLKHGAIEVAQVVINRTKHPSYPDTPCEVIFQRKQFTNIKKKPISENSWKATYAAIEAYSTGTANKTIIAFHSLPSKPKTWSNLSFVLRIGRHSFYKQRK